MKSKFIRVSSADPCGACLRGHGCSYVISDDGKKITLCLRAKEGVKLARDGRGIHIESFNGEAPSQLPRPCQASIARRNAVYRQMLNLLTLNAGDRQHLGGRGFSEGELANLGYKSTGQVAPALESAGYILDRVPGFYRDQGVWQMNTRPGFFIPALDPQGRIQALQMRTYSKEYKYKWFSSFYRVTPDGSRQLLEKGASSGSPVHHRGGSRSELWLTESPLKADVIWSRLARAALGIAGVNSSHAEAASATIGYDRVVLAFDLDWMDNPQVRQALGSLVERISNRSSAAIEIALWEGHKGVDDALMAGARIETVPYVKIRSSR